MLDVFVMMEGYCLLLTERVDLIEQERVCPDELKEAISGMLYASTRCGEFPELQEIRALFTSRYGKEFTARAVELRNNCGVNPKIIQKLSTRMPSLDNRMRILKEIASENNIVLQLEEPSSVTTDGNQNQNQNQNYNQSKADSEQPKSSGEGLQTLPETKENEEGFSGSMKTKKYRDVADAAQAAFESAAYAAAAARAAVELSRSDPRDPDSPNPRPRKIFNSDDSSKSKNSDEEQGQVKDPELEKENRPSKMENKGTHNGTEHKRTMPGESSDSAEDVLNASIMLDKEVAFDESDDENVKKQMFLNINRKPISVRTRRLHVP